jgi:hypothetical protein
MRWLPVLLVLAASAAAAEPAVKPPSGFGVRCADWRRTENGDWQSNERASLTWPRAPGSFANETVYRTPEKLYFLGGFDLYAWLETHCPH